MKRLTFILVFFMIAVTACCQTDQTFVKPIYANAGIYFLDGTFLNTAIGGGAVTWDAVLNKPVLFPPTVHSHDLLYKPIGYVPSWAEITGKPTVFAPAAHNHDLLYKPITYVPTWTEITNKPVEIELINELPLLAYLPLPQKTTAEINATVVPAGTIAMVWDKTLQVVKLWNGSVWKTIITNQ